MSHTDVKEISDKKVLDVAVTPVTEKEIHLSGTLKGNGSTTAVAHYGSNNMITLRYRLKDLKVQAAEKEFKQGDTTFPAGSFVIPGDSARVRTEVEKLGLTAVALRSVPNVPLHDVDLPRLAMYSTWGNTQDVGWVRYAFDKFEIPYKLIYKERVKKGDLRGSYDVVIVPHQSTSGKRLVFDIENRGQPIEYKKIRPIQESRHVWRIRRHHRRDGTRRRRRIREVREGGRRAGDAWDGQLLACGIRPGAAGRRGAHVTTILRAGTNRRCGDSEAGAPDFLRV